MKHCIHCNKKVYIDSTDDGDVCSNCGHIISKGSFYCEPTSFVNEENKRVFLEGKRVSNITVNSSFIHVDKYNKHATTKDEAEYKKKKLLEMIEKQISFIPIASQFSDFIISKTLLVMKDQIKLERKGRLIVASIIYAICRDNGRPLSLMDVSNALDCNFFQLGKVFTKLKQQFFPNLKDIDPTVFIERSISGLLKDNFSDEEKLALCKKVQLIMDYAYDHHLGTGRKPLSMVGATVSIILHGTYRCKHIKLKDIAAALNVTEHTIRSRQKEILLLLEKLLKELPWGSTGNLKKVEDNVDQICMYIEFMKRKKKGNGGEKQKDVNVGEKTKRDVRLPMVASKKKDEKDMKKTGDDSKQIIQEHASPKRSIETVSSMDPSLINRSHKMAKKQVDQESIIPKDISIEERDENKTEEHKKDFKPKIDPSNDQMNASNHLLDPSKTTPIYSYTSLPSPSFVNPPSFDANLKKRQQLSLKVQQAKHRLWNFSHHSNSLSEQAILKSFQDFNPKDCCDHHTCIHPLTKEILDIQNLLLNGVKEDVIIEGHLKSIKENNAQTSLYYHHQKQDEKIVNMYIRTEEEVKSLSIVNEM